MTARQRQNLLQYLGYYEGSIDGIYGPQTKQAVEDFQREENRLLPPDADYAAIGGLRVEARQKLAEIRPLSIGQASRISGVSPADIAVLLIWLGQQEQ